LAFIWHPDQISKDNLRLQIESVREIESTINWCSILPEVEIQNKQPQPSPSKDFSLQRPKSHRVPYCSNHPFQSQLQARKHIIPILSGADLWGAKSERKKTLSQKKPDKCQPE